MAIYFMWKSADFQNAIYVADGIVYVVQRDEVSGDAEVFPRVLDVIPRYWIETFGKDAKRTGQGRELWNEFERRFGATWCSPVYRGQAQVDEPFLAELHERWGPRLLNRVVLPQSIGHLKTPKALSELVRHLGSLRKSCREVPAPLLGLCEEMTRLFGDSVQRLTTALADAHVVRISEPKPPEIFPILRISQDMNIAIENLRSALIADNILPSEDMSTGISHSLLSSHAQMPGFEQGQVASFGQSVNLPLEEAARVLVRAKAIVRNPIQREVQLMAGLGSLLGRIVELELMSPIDPTSGLG